MIPEETNRSGSTGILTHTIKETKTVDELLDVFDSYILPTEFAIGLQKLCQMASVENSDAIHLYQQGDKRRQRIETLLLSFVSDVLDCRREKKSNQSFYLILVEQIQ